MVHGFRRSESRLSDKHAGEHAGEQEVCKPLVVSSLGKGGFRLEIRCCVSVTANPQILRFATQTPQPLSST